MDVDGMAAQAWMTWKSEEQTANVIHLHVSDSEGL